MILLPLRPLPELNVTNAVSIFLQPVALKTPLTTSDRFIACCGSDYPLLKVVPKRDFLFDRYHTLG